MLDPTIDIVFRSLLSSEANEDVLIFVINAVLQSEKPIVSVRIKNPFNLAEYKNAKLSILDIKAVDWKGGRSILRCSFCTTPSMEEQRSIYESEVKRRMVDSIQLETAQETGRVEGRQEGIQQGVQQGVQQGIQQGMQHVILRMLHQILPGIPDTTIAKLKALDSATLDDLSAALFSFHSVDDVEGWLADR